MKTVGLAYKIWLSAVSVIAVGAIVMGTIGFINSDNSKEASLPTINQQVDSINDTIPDIEAVNTELKKYINKVKKATESLRSDLNETDSNITTLESEIYNKVDSNNASLLSKLEKKKTTLESKLAKTNKKLSSAKADNKASEKDITGRISKLEKEVAELQAELNKTNEGIEAVKAELKSIINASEKKVLDELKIKTDDTLISIDTISSKTSNLEIENNKLEGDILIVKNTVLDTIKAEKDASAATYATLEQYNSLQTDISNIKQSIEDINTAIASLQTNLNAEISEIKSSISDLNDTLSEQVLKITNNYTEAVNKAKTDITTAYTAAISVAITRSETAMKSWVNTTLQNGYYTIIQIDTKINALNTNDSSLKAEIDAQKTALENAKTALETAYNAAITSAINEYNGKITEEIEKKISDANIDLSSEISTINSQITAIQQQVDKNKSDIKDLQDKVNGLANCLNDTHEATVEYNWTYTPEDEMNYGQLENVQCVATVKCVYCGKEIGQRTGRITALNSTIYGSADGIYCADFGTGLPKQYYKVGVGPIPEPQLPTSPIIIDPGSGGQSPVMP